MWQSLNKIIEKQKTLLFKNQRAFLSLHSAPTLFRQLSLSLTLPFSSSSFSIEAPSKASTFGHHFCPKSRNEGIFGVVKCVATSGTSKIQLGRIDGDPVLRETRIWATWEYVSLVGGGQQGMVGLCAHCGCGKLVVHHRPTAT
ncbi:hypothetical protein GmHk_08G023361 [Glycine max]|nr:hypothetical protein GmHk_08G023361 [Glycine max]